MTIEYILLQMRTINKLTYMDYCYILIQSIGKGIINIYTMYVY